ncbi:MAG: replication-associated recombination protein A [Blastocatellia bacterium]|nr:replication-associated recombination protein A [Blastocatellia bacterium]MCS7156872.1 replication-associated recombination protein A [Blastocatellia bacterium]MCX7752830.1 replication-associated recombination protein A [Blastocatellia bacterium]MDW8167564.1 replication-associated recombination protein A [Acidobacteriota bacterium]MDW8256164.1 replication-associated recombination protein A [Acidobacteriota bacterium]
MEEERTLFPISSDDAEASHSAPLADRLRPRTLDEVVGQAELIGPGKPLRRLIERDQLASMILWGPPGSGKTTLARVIAQHTKAHFLSFSAVLGTIKEIRQAMLRAERVRRVQGRRTILFVDEVHHLNRAQQDAFLPFIERGDVVFIGATTENPSFQMIAPLLSRCHVFVLKPLSDDDVLLILRRALADEERGLGHLRVEIAEPLLRVIATHASGDARVALNVLELAVNSAERYPDGTLRVTEDIVREIIRRPMLFSDRGGEEHYNLTSAFIKSVRHSDADAALYWLARMLEAGEDPLFIARRLVILASEDVGLADPQALVQAVAAMQAVHFVGLPEAKLALTQATLYLARAPKSNAVLRAYRAAERDACEYPREPVPLHLRNPVTTLMREMGYGVGYKYIHDYEPGAPDAEMPCLPESLRGRKYFDEDPPSEGERVASE